MLLNSFCHLDGINLKKEAKIWDIGIKNWEDALSAESLCDSSKNDLLEFRKGIEFSYQKLEEKATDYFFDKIPRDQHWRFFKEFKDEMAYLDIETTGLTRFDSVTVVSIYHKGKLGIYVKGINFDKLLADITIPRIFVTYNGNKFDLPFLENYFGIKIFQNRIDLRYVLSNLGYRGGLKKCEKMLGISREGMKDIDGNIAVMLWEDYKHNKNIKALKTLIAYNVSDAVNLEKLSAIAYNENVKKTKRNFGFLEIPEKKTVPFFPNPTTVKKLLQNLK